MFNRIRDVLSALVSWIFEPEVASKKRRDYIKDHEELRHFEVIELDLGVERDKTEYDVYGDRVIVSDIDGECDIYFNHDTVNYVELDKIRDISCDFWKFYISNSIQTGKTCRLLIGKHGIFSAFQDVARESKQGLVYMISASDTLQISDDEVKQNNSDVWLKVKQFTIFMHGSLKIYWEMHREAGKANSAQCQVRVNGEMVGSQENSTEDDYEAFEHTLVIAEGDLLQLWLRSSNFGDNTFLRYARVKGDSDLTSDVGAVSID